MYLVSQGPIYRFVVVNLNAFVFQILNSINILSCIFRMRRAVERLRTDAILRAHAKGLRAADRWKDV